MCFRGMGDSCARSSAWVVFPVPGVPVMTMTGLCRDVDIGWICKTEGSARARSEARWFGDGRGCEQCTRGTCAGKVDIPSDRAKDEGTRGIPSPMQSTPIGWICVHSRRGPLSRLPHTHRRLLFALGSTGRRGRVAGTVFVAGRLHACLTRDTWPGTDAEGRRCGCQRQSGPKTGLIMPGRGKSRGCGW